MSVIIMDVAPDSPAQRHKICHGDTLVSINDNSITDILDYRFYEVNTKVSLKILHNGRMRTVKIKKDEYAPIGLLFNTYLMDRQRHCKNACIFCFVDQMPRGMRDSLYFKDDDTRLSFFFGNYVTLTNLTDSEADRLIRMHISPINVSVHTTEPELRVRMMKNPNAGKSLKYLRQFADAGIALNCQLVICPGINDKEHLSRSLCDLAALGVASIAVVPLGMTRFREGLEPLMPFTHDTALETVTRVERFAKKHRESHGVSLAFCSDELYLRAGLPLPGYDYYEDFSQLENGVGMITLFKSELHDALCETAKSDTALSVTFVTGTDAADTIQAALDSAKSVFTGLEGDVRAIKNDYFGHSITVAGLVTAKDIISQLKNTEYSDIIVVPDVMLRHEQDRFLDDLTVDDIERELGVRVVVSKADGQGFCDTLCALVEETEKK